MLQGDDIQNNLLYIPQQPVVQLKVKYLSRKPWHPSVLSTSSLQDLHSFIATKYGFPHPTKILLVTPEGTLPYFTNDTLSMWLARYPPKVPLLEICVEYGDLTIEYKFAQGKTFATPQNMRNPIHVLFEEVSTLLNTPTSSFNLHYFELCITHSNKNTLQELTKIPTQFLKRPGYALHVVMKVIDANKLTLLPLPANIPLLSAQTSPKMPAPDQTLSQSPSQTSSQTPPQIHPSSQTYSSISVPSTSQSRKGAKGKGKKGKHKGRANRK